MSAVAALAVVIRLNTRLFLNCLDGVADERAAERPGGKTNNLPFVACHLVDSRFYTAGLLGLELSNPFGQLLGDASGIDDVPVLPPLARIREAWNTVSVELEACVASLGYEDTGLLSPQQFPVDDPTLLGALAFLVQHESYHIGQLGLLRRYLGYPAMSYR